MIDISRGEIADKKVLDIYIPWMGRCGGEGVVLNSHEGRYCPKVILESMLPVIMTQIVSAVMIFSYSQNEETSGCHKS